MIRWLPLLLIASTANAQSTATLTVTATLVDAYIADADLYPSAINGAPVEVWTVVIDGRNEARSRPCDACPWVRDDEIEDYDWTDYPYPPPPPPILPPDALIVTTTAGP